MGRIDQALELTITVPLVTYPHSSFESQQSRPPALLVEPQRNIVTYTGVPVHLPDGTFGEVVLGPGEVFTRGEIRSKLWDSMIR